MSDFTKKYLFIFNKTFNEVEFGDVDYPIHGDHLFFATLEEAKDLVRDLREWTRFEMCPGQAKLKEKANEKEEESF